MNIYPAFWLTSVKQMSSFSIQESFESQPLIMYRTEGFVLGSASLSGLCILSQLNEMDCSF